MDPNEKAKLKVDEWLIGLMTAIKPTKRYYVTLFLTGFFSGFFQVLGFLIAPFFLLVAFSVMLVGMFSAFVLDFHTKNTKRRKK